MKIGYTVIVAENSMQGVQEGICYTQDGEPAFFKTKKEAEIHREELNGQWPELDYYIAEIHYAG